MLNNKTDQRNSVKQARLDISKDLYQAYSDTICLKIMNLDKYIKADTVMAYCPVNHEVDTSLLLEDCIADRKLVLPKTDKKSNTIIPCYVDSLSDLIEGAYSILEPKDGCETAKLKDIDIIIVPMVAFDKKGTRLGYGGGYYDRLLKDMKDSIKIGIAFSLQELESIKKEDHDIDLDVIITEKKIFNF